MDDVRKNETPEESTKDAKVTERRKEFARRALLHAGWVTPLVLTLNIPSAFAQSPGPQHFDHTDHNDAPHSDLPHTDTPTHTDHADSPHQDHLDHVDSHIDSHTDVHQDVAPHVDVPHADASTARGPSR